MLDKQGWRFLTNPTSLVSQVYKGRYYLRGNFLDSVLGNHSNFSFIWRSIWEAKDVIYAGMRWKVGSRNQSILLINLGY